MLSAMKKILFSFATFLVILSLLSWQQQPKKENPYGLEIVSDLAVYHHLVEKDPANELVDIEKIIKGIVLDIRYATINNFTHKVIYPSPKAFVRKPVAEALVKIQHELNEKGLGLKIFDAYRPYSVTLKFYEAFPDTNFVASPRFGSRHNRGCAVDLTIIDLKTKKELEMPTFFDDFTEKANHSYINLPKNALKNRQLLKEMMTKYGFVVYESEWWHYDFGGWRNFKLMDIAFEELNYEKGKPLSIKKNAEVQ